MDYVIAMAEEIMKRKSVEEVLLNIRPAIRNGHPYMVGGMMEPDIKLNQNESPYDLPDDLKRELIDTFFEIPFNRYPRIVPDTLCNALGEYWNFDPDGIIVGNGSNELMHLLGLSIIEKGTTVVLPRPMFSFYEAMARCYEGDLVFIPPRPDLHFDAAGMYKAVCDKQPALTVIASPNNPTGLAMSLTDIERIVQAAAGFVVVDEAYLEFSEEESAQSIMGQYPNIVLLRTMSKAWGLAGLRIGYLMAPPEIVREMLKARVPFMVDRLAEATALALLKRPGLVQERAAVIIGQRKALTVALNELEDVSAVPSQANFVLFQTPLKPKVMMDRLANYGVLVRNMGGYPELKRYLRVNAGTPDENNVFLDALKKALK